MSDFGGRFGRGSRLARTGVLSLAGLASARAKELSGQDGSVDSHEAIAERLREVLGDMKGAAMKVGQLLSFVDLDLPPEIQDTYHEILAELRDAAPPFDPDAIRETVTAEFGMPPERVFAEWSDEPLASASIGQVHPAVTEDGREVAVKVQYPGVARAVRADLSNAETFAPLARLVSPNLEIRELMEELRERVEDELDYVREASYQQAFARRWDGHPDIHVPGVVRELCREKVLVTERVWGRTYDAVVQDGTEEERQHFGEAVHRFVFGSLGRFRLFNADPHPGNYLYQDDGRVAFIDFGAVKMFTKQQWEQLLQLESTAVDGDRAAWERAMRRARLLPEDDGIDVDLVWEYFRLMQKPAIAEQPFTYTRAYAAEVIGHASNMRGPYWNVLRKLNLPPEFLMINRIQLGVNSVLGRLGATNDWHALRDHILAKGPPTTALSQRDEEWWQAQNQ